MAKVVKVSSANFKPLFPRTTDINECKTGTHDCDTSVSKCRNRKGSFECKCLKGYIKNGSKCIGMFLFSLLNSHDKVVFESVNDGRFLRRT